MNETIARQIFAGVMSVVLAGGFAFEAAAGNLKPQVKVGAPVDDAALRSVCHLSIKRRVALLFGRAYTGSAVLYRGRYLLTAGHNVYQDNSRIRSVEVRCGASDARTEMFHEKIEPWQVLDASGYDGDPFFRDFGVIRLRQPITVDGGSFSLAMMPIKVGDSVRFAGYPGGPHSGWEMFQARDGLIAATNDGIAYYDVATFKSNSGGSVWRDVAGNAQLVAIHVTESGGRVVDDVYRAEVEKLIAELDRRAAERGL